MVKNRAGAIVEASQIKVNSNETIARVDESPMLSDPLKVHLLYENASSCSNPSDDSIRLIGNGLTISDDLGPVFDHQ